MKKLLVLVIISFLTFSCCKDIEVKPEPIEKDYISYYIYSAGLIENGDSEFNVGYRSYDNKLEYVDVKEVRHLTLTFTEKIEYYEGMIPVLIITPDNSDGHVWCEVYILHNNDTIVSEQLYIFDETIFD